MRAQENMFDVRVMNQQEAEIIADTWTYESPFDFYNMINDPKHYNEFTSPHLRKNHFVVYKDNHLFGFFCYDYLEKKC